MFIPETTTCSETETTTCSCCFFNFWPVASNHFVVGMPLISGEDEDADVIRVLEIRTGNVYATTKTLTQGSFGTYTGFNFDFNDFNTMITGVLFRSKFKVRLDISVNGVHQKGRFSLNNSFHEAIKPTVKLSDRFRVFYVFPSLVQINLLAQFKNVYNRQNFLLAMINQARKHHNANQVLILMLPYDILAGLWEFWWIFAKPTLADASDWVSFILNHDW